MSGPEQARAQAARALGELAKDVLPRTAGARVMEIRVEDEQREPLFELRLRFEVLRNGNGSGQAD